MDSCDVKQGHLRSTAGRVAGSEVTGLCLGDVFNCCYYGLAICGKEVGIVELLG